MKVTPKIEANFTVGKLLSDYLKSRCPQSQPRVFELAGQPGKWVICVLKKGTKFYETQKGVYSPTAPETKCETIQSYCDLVLDLAGYSPQNDGGRLVYV